MDYVFDQLASAGITVDGALEFGRLVRCKTEDDRGTKKSGWYVLHELKLENGSVVVVGRFGNWKRYGDEAQAIKFDGAMLSEQERQRLADEQHRLREQADAEKRARAAQAASRALRIWQKLPDGGASPYLDRKQVGAYGVKFSRGSIVVPVRNAHHELVGLQFIAPDGDKKFLTGTAKRGCYHIVGEFPDNADPAAMLWIAEGYATAATVHKATGQPCAVAFDAGNLLPVATAIRALLPLANIGIAADNDSKTPGNPGVTKAREAALAVGGVVVVPEFGRVAA